MLSDLPTMRVDLDLPPPRPVVAHSSLPAPPPLVRPPLSAPTRRSVILRTLQTRSPLAFSPDRVIRLQDTFPPPSGPQPPLPRPRSPPYVTVPPARPPTPPPLSATEYTYRIVYERQLNSPTLDILVALIADEDTPEPPPPPPLPSGPPPQPPDPPPQPPDPHDSWCTCPPCLDALTALYD